MAEPPKADAEQAMIAEVFAPLSQGLPGALGLKDDAAVLSAPEGSELVVTMDTLVEGVHFLFDGSAREAADAAYKALAVNVSDLAAKGADPLAYLLSLTLPAAGAGDWLGGLADGLRQGQEAWGLHLAGGDTVRGRSGLALTVTALGSAPQGSALRRTGAKPGDRLIVTGTIGCAWAGLELRGGGGAAEAFRKILSATDANALIARYQRPSPRVRLAEPLRISASAAMDVSDGLILDLERLCRASGVGAVLNADRVPLSKSVRTLVENGLIGLDAPLSGGDDYEILAAVPASAVESLIAAAQNEGITVTEIGEVTETPSVRVVGADGAPIAVQRKGWDHLSGPLPDPS